MSALRFFGALTKISRTNIKLSHAVQIRCVASQERKHTKFKVVDNVGVIVLNSPGVKVIHVNKILIFANI
ncbi:hypothetical protein MTP99_010503 [Tenebrio molitor]|nr:hypothetical protein MTP99_010503 [Tenebrio molitor]